MALQVPELLQPNIANIDDVVALRDGRLGMRPCDHRAEGRDEAGEGLIEGEQAEVLGCDFRRCCLGLGEGFLVRRDILRVQRCNLKKVQRDTALVTSAEPLGVLNARQPYGAACAQNKGAGTSCRVCSNSSTSIISNKSSMF